MAAYIHRVRIDTYRTIRDLDVDLRPRPEDVQPFRHLILTGPNGSGKSSVLSSLVSEVSTQSSSGLLTWSEPLSSPPTLIYIPTHRRLQLGHVNGPSKLPLPNETVKAGLSRFFLQYLVNRKTEQAFAVIDKDRGKETAVAVWFDRFQDHLRWLFEDPGLGLEFDSKRFDFKIRRGDGSSHGLQELADGHAAFLAIFAEIEIGIEAAQQSGGVPDGDDVPRGIVVLDEIENHLHLRLQEQALPFLTDLFPGFQFITATHSPAVIASVPDAVVYDMARHTATPSEKFVGVRYGTMLTEHFDVPSEFDLDSTIKLEELRTLAAGAETANGARCQALAELLSRRSPTLQYEVWRILHEPKATGGLR